ncbi:MAG: hypothetical protein ACI8TP_003578 [Acidimicrobiales bacterium]
MTPIAAMVMPEMTTSSRQLLPVLERARAVGFLGPGPLRVHMAHADRYAEALHPGASRLLDLGSGGGVPGLPIFAASPGLSGVLLDASARRCAFLLWAVTELDLASRVDVWEGRAEDLAGPETMAFDHVLCRGFGPPAQTVECALGFTAANGRIVISEPPERRPWPHERLRELGLAVDVSVTGLVSFDLVDDSVRPRPRPIKTQRRNPLFSLDP